MKSVILSLIVLGASTFGYAQTSANEGNESKPIDEGVTIEGAISVNVSIDVLGIANAIAGAVNANANRAGFVKSLMESAFYSAGQRYNVMVFNLSHSYDDRFQGVKFFGSTTYNGVVYGIWVFESGEFTNQGDGGWINWAFRGWFNRNGAHVTFSKP